MDRISSIAAESLSQPALPALIGTATCSALPSPEGIGPTDARSTALTALNFATCAFTEAMSWGVSAAARSYTTMAGTSSLDWNCCDARTTLVDSALPGSHAVASFFSAPMSKPDGPATSAATMTQKISTAHFDLRPAGNHASVPTSAVRSALIEGLPATDAYELAIPTLGVRRQT